MPKHHNKQSMAEDYLSRAEWESIHPYDGRGRPSAKYQPNWKYKRVYPKTRRRSKAEKIALGILIAIGIIVSVFGPFIYYADNTGKAIVTSIAVLSLLVTIYFLVRERK